METVNMHEAKTRLSTLVDKAVKGEPFIIAKPGKPVARVSAIESPEADNQRRLGFMRGLIRVPDDFDRMGEQAIAEMFGGKA